MDTPRRDFIRKTALGTAGLTVGGLFTGMSAKSYAKIIGANERLNLAIIGLGRRLGAYYDPISREDSNVELVYLRDVMKKQQKDGAQKFSRYISYKSKLENDVRKIIGDKQVDALFS